MTEVEQPADAAVLDKENHVTNGVHDAKDDEEKTGMNPDCEGDNEAAEDGSAPEKAKKKKKKKKKGGGGGGGKKQTDPPTIPITELFPNNTYPIGEVMDHPTFTDERKARHRYK